MCHRHQPERQPSVQTQLQGHENGAKNDRRHEARRFRSPRSRHDFDVSALSTIYQVQFDSIKRSTVSFLLILQTKLIQTGQSEWSE